MNISTLLPATSTPASRGIRWPGLPRRVVLSLLAFAFFLMPGRVDAAELIASDGETLDYFGYFGSRSGSMALVGIYYDENNHPGSQNAADVAYLYRNLDTAKGTVTETVRLATTDYRHLDTIRTGVSLSGNIALVGPFSVNSGMVCVYRIYDFGKIDNQGTGANKGAVTESAQLWAGGPGWIGTVNDGFGHAISLEGETALISAPLGYSAGYEGYRFDGIVYMYRELGSVTGPVIQDVRLLPADGKAGNYFGRSVSLSGNTGLVGAPGDGVNGKESGAAYLFHNLPLYGYIDVWSPPIYSTIKLVASNGKAGDSFGESVSVSDKISLVGAPQDGGFDGPEGTGCAYVFNNMSRYGTPDKDPPEEPEVFLFPENASLIPSDGKTGDQFGQSVSISGTTGLVGAPGSSTVYIYLGLDKVNDIHIENVKVAVSGGVKNSRLGRSVSLDGDGFVIGANAVTGPGGEALAGAAYTGSVASMTTLNRGNASEVISRLSFISRQDWVIGQTRDKNKVVLSRGDAATVMGLDRAVYIGREAGSDNNLLVLEGMLNANAVYIGAVSGNTGNSLQIEETGGFSAVGLSPGARKHPENQGRPHPYRRSPESSGHGEN